jgi:hypothetical protein
MAALHLRGPKVEMADSLPLKDGDWCYSEFSFKRRLVLPNPVTSVT